MQWLPLRWRLFGILCLVGSGPILLLLLLGWVDLQALWLVPGVAAVAYGLAVIAAEPLDELVAVARRIGQGELGARMVPTPGSTVDELARVLFGLAGRLDLVTRSLEEQVGERTAALNRKAEQLRAVGQVGQQVAAVLEPDALLHFVVRVMRGAFGYDVAAVLQRHGEHLILAACAARGTEEPPLGRAFPLAALLRDDGERGTAPSPLVNGVQARAELAVPVRLGERVLGVLVVQSTHPDALDDEDLFTVRTIAGQVAVALENARLFEAERKLRDLAVTEERNRMAREIHDTLAQGFMGIIMHLRALQGAAEPEMARLHRAQAEELARESLQEARRSVWNLRPHTLEGRGLAGALAAEAENLQRRTGVQAHFATEGDVSHLPAAAEAGLLRIAQEALHNVTKYARAASVQVRLTVDSDSAELSIADDGVGFDPSLHPTPTAGGGFGLGGMRERAHLLGGVLQVDAAPGNGCRITARVPLK